MLGFLPNIESDESFDGYQGRVAAMSGKRHAYIDHEPHLAGSARKATEFFDYAGCDVIMNLVDVITNHTLYPYHAAFSPSYRNSRVDLTSMKYCMAPLSPTPRRFCRDCVEEDLCNRGFAMWKTLHYLPFSQVCPLHNSDLFRLPGVVARALDRTLFKKAKKPHQIENRSLFGAVASHGRWILANRPKSVPHGELHRRMEELLRDAGLPTDITILGQILIRHYGKRDLEILRVLSGDVLKHSAPVALLLLLTFMDLETRSLFICDQDINAQIDSWA